MNQGYDNYGVPRDIFARFKMGIFYGVDFAVMAAGFFLTYYFNKLFPISQWPRMIIFDVISAGIVLFLIIHTNGGKRNYMILLLFLRMKTGRIKRIFKPITSVKMKEINTDADF
ncbi:hypothetical protein OGZ51_10505 [Lactococcus lactis]|uniref:Uncharacterized protein n=1 Tax=Lactococcus lactis TaxID=1358 RepID=A0A9X4S7D9_9LACT|nr:hypothetical protein [Lactococcus lactis]MDG4984576.1 hypothetical protein [Lactococcus lactis]